MRSNIGIYLTVVLVAFVILSGCKKEDSAQLPTLTSAKGVVAYTTAQCGANITYDGGAQVTAYGFCWSTEANPTINNDTIIAGSGIGEYTSILFSLTPNTVYYVRAFATNKAGTAYSEQMTFTTLALGSPAISTITASSITMTTAACGGNISSSNGDSVIVCGVCWSTSSNPSITNDTTANPGAIGEFIDTLTSLTLNTKYYVRAYATNTQGTSYGEEISFTTKKAGKPLVLSSSVNTMTTVSAICGGNVTADSGAVVTSKGICWSSSHNPTIANSKLICGNGTGRFSDTITRLKGNTTYYVRAFATNSSGTSYGVEVSFRTTLGKVTYNLIKASNPTAEQQTAYNLITQAMDSAVWYYNHYTSIEKSLNIYYEPSVPTADGNINGTIRFGQTAYMKTLTAMHEIAHTVGVGTSWKWPTLMVSGSYRGTHANNMLRAIKGNLTDVMHGDGMHMWPYGLNYQSEYTGITDLINHCYIVNAMKLDGM